MKKRILVTGGAGFVGAHTCKALSLLGYEAVAFDNLSQGHREFVKWGPLEEGDVTNRASVDFAIKKWKPAAVFHFASSLDVHESVGNPAKYYRNNVIGSLNVLDSMKENSVKYFIFSSTCATYGIPTTVPILEAHPQKPIHPYGDSKWMVEHILHSYEKAYGIKSVSLRYFNAAGADPAGEIGEDHRPESHLIPLVLDVALGRRSHIFIYGNDYETPDGTCIRDYIHVEDLAAGHIRALEYLMNGGESVSLNLGSGKGYSVKEVIEVAQRVTGKNILFEIAGRREGDVPVLCSTFEKAAKTLQWQPRFSELPVIIEQAWNWHQRRFSHGS